MITLHDCEIFFIVLGYYMFWEFKEKKSWNITELGNVVEGKENHGIVHRCEISLRKRSII